MNGTFAPFTVVMAWRVRECGGDGRVVGVPHEPPLPGRDGVWEGSAAVSQPPIFDASGRDHPGGRGGRAGGWEARVSCLLRAIVAVGVRTLARCATGARGSAAHAPPGALRRVRDDACALALLDGSAPARRGRGDRRGAAPGGCRGRASSDRPAAPTARRHGAWLAACRPQTRRKPARVGDPADCRAGPRTGRGHPGRQRSGRRGRGDHARRSCVGAAVRRRRSRPPGNARSGRPAGCCTLTRRCRHNSRWFVVVPRGHDLIAIQLRTAAAGQAPRQPSMVSCARVSALDARRRRSYPVDRGSGPLNDRAAGLTSSFVPTLRSPSKAARACRS
jgi:hypothetical protein